MQHKNYRKRFNLFFSTMTSSLVLLIVTLLSKFILFFLSSEILNPTINVLFEKLREIFIVSSSISSFLLVMLLSMAISLFCFELIYRINNDSIYNFVQSVVKTFRIRKFLLRDIVNEVDNDVKIYAFNKSVRKAVIDVTNSNVCFCMKLPDNAESIRLLKGVQTELKEEITNYFFEDYHFSDYDRNKQFLFLKGSKKDSL